MDSSPVPLLAAALVVPALGALASHAAPPGTPAGAAQSPDRSPWRAAWAWLSGERDRLAADLATAHGGLLARACEGRPDLVERLEPTPPAPTPSGWGILPRVAADAALSTARPRERRYSLERLTTGFAGERRDAALLAGAAGAGDEDRLADQVAEFERLKERLRDLEEHLSYHEWWQEAAVEDAAAFAARNESVALTREWRRVVEAGDDPERARRLERELLARVAPFTATRGLAIEEAPDGARTLAVEVHTDIADEAFLGALVAGVDAAWNRASAMGAARLRIELTLVRRPIDELYPEGAPARGAAIDTDDHLARFGEGVLTLTTGAPSTHARVGRHILLGPGKVTPRTLAHEFGHLLGFTDAYLRGYDGSPGDRFGVVLVEWSGLRDDLMGASGGGRVSEGMVARLTEAYGAP
ncbi:MAG: hypothetical protein QF903_10530 [Planctomycetota bacterium]|nr:hypothetical protein [Planctomycetota bacterium]MDP6762993.1 hypothetical protein [Planctomycetota bacterium]MDP6989903.1 hypothetical protein [Planctomycetota bacterium]